MRNILVQQLLRKYKPRLVVVFGRHGVEEARSAVATVLGKHAPVFDSTAERFFDGIYDQSGGFLGAVRSLFVSTTFPHFCVVDADPDSASFAEIREVLELDLAVVAAVGDIPSFTSIFAGPQKRSEKIAREARKAKNIVYIQDDETVRDLISDLPVSKRSYGFDDAADIRADKASNWIYLKEKVSGGVTLKVERDGSLIPFNIINCFGKRNIYASLCALGAALCYDINFVSATQDLNDYEAPMHSLSLRAGIKSSAILAHTYDVTPLSARESLELIGGLREDGEIGRVVVVLGDVLLRIKEESEDLHRVLGELAAHNSDELVLIGERVIFTEEEAQKHGMPASSILRRHTVEEALDDISSRIKKGDTVLVLGSAEMKLERVVERIQDQ